MIKTDVLIIGAGPAGLVLAAELARYRLKVRIIDRKDRPSRYSKALGVMPRTLELLERPGLTGKMLEAGNALQGMNIYNGRSHTFFPTNEFLDSPYPILVLPQSYTEQILIEKLKEYDIEVEWNTELTGIVQEEDRVHATLELPGGEIMETDFPWAAACDGSRSTARQLLEMNFETREVRESFLLVDLDILWDLNHTETHTFLSVDGDMAVFPFADRPFCRMVLPDFNPSGGTDFQNEEITLEAVDRLFRKRCLFQAELKKPEWISTFRIKEGILDKYRNGRVFFAGDAAHVHSPQGGQGMNSGIQDAFNLGWKLAMVHHGTSRPELLETYQQERRPVAKKIIRTTGRTTDITLFENPRLRKLRNFLITSTAPLYGKFMVQSIGNLNLSYSKNKFITDSIPLKSRLNPFGSSPGAGERVADVMWIDSKGKNQRLFDILKSMDLLMLYFTFDYPGIDIWKQFRHYADLEIYQIVRNPVKEAPKKQILTDPGGRVFGKFGLRQSAIYIIRPDGYIGLQNQPANVRQTIRYLDSFFDKSKTRP